MSRKGTATFAPSALPAPTRRVRPAAIAAVMALVGLSIFAGAGAAHAAGPIDAPIIDTPTDGTQDPDAQPQIQGSLTGSEPDLMVVVNVANSNGTSTYCTDPAPQPTSWTCAGAAPLPMGTNVFTANAFYGPTSVNYTDTTSSPPSNVVNYLRYGVVGPSALVSPPSPSTDSTPTFSGKGPEFGTITVSEASTTLCTAAPDISGDWSCDSIPLGIGTHAADASARDAQNVDRGTASFSGFTIDPPNTPTIDQTFSDPWTTSYPYPAIQGGKDADVTRVLVTYAGITYCDLTGLSAATVWYCTTPNGAPLQLGMNNLDATGYNSNGDPSVASLQPLQITLVPRPTIDSPADGFATNNSSPTFSGTTAAGNTITLWYGGEGRLCSAEVAQGAWQCTASNLADGTYTFFADASPGQYVSSTNHRITIDTVAPAAPVVVGPAGTTTDRTPTVFGTGEPGAQVTIFLGGSVEACAGGAPIVDGTGSWQCTIASSLDIDSYSIRAMQRDAATNVSPTSPVIFLTIALPPAPPAPKAPLTWKLNTGGVTDFLPGATVELSSSGLPPGSVVSAEFHSVPVNLGSTMVQPDGTFLMRVTIPADTPPGAHHFVVTVTPPGEAPSVVDVPATVLPAPKEAAAGPAKDPATTTSHGGAVGTQRDDPAAASSLTHSIGTLGDLLSNPVVVGAAAAAGLALLLLVAFPAELLNSTISEQYRRFARHLPRLRGGWLRRFAAWLARAPLLGGLGVTLAAAVIFGFADPGFGFDITSLRLVLACAIALFIVGYLASSIAGVIIRRRWALSTTMELKPLGLVLAVIGVVMSRILDFSPGFMLGLILGISLVGSTTVAERAKATLVQAGAVFVLAMLGWVGYSILSATTAPDSFGSALAFDTMVAVTTEGLTALFIGMLPFRFLDGQSVFAFSRLIWAASFVLSAVAFLLVVLPTSWGQVTGSLWLWVSVVGGFGVVALGIYVYFRFWAPPLDEDESDAEVPVVAANK